ncbi:MAG: tetratricopeptide repeat protein [Bacteroidales bacterium]|nr:tetratricopeptide repeat protein [Bacteroidales bacterium]
MSVSEQLNYIESAINLISHSHLTPEYAYEKAALMVRRGHLLFSNADYTEALKANDSAIAFIEKAQTEYRQPGDQSPDPWNLLLMEALSNKGLALVYHGQSNLAIETFLTILEQYGQTADSNNIALARSYNGMGITFANRNQYDVALPYLRKSLEIYENLNDPRGIYLLNSNIGAAYLNQGLYQDALPYLYKVQEIVLKQNYNGDEPIYANSQLGLAYQGFGDYALAEHFFLEALKLADRKQYNHLLPFINNLYARNLIHQKRYAEAEQIGLQLRQDLKNRRGTEALDIEALGTLAEAAAAQGNYQAGYNYLMERARKVESLEKRIRLETLSQQKYEFEHYRQEQQNALEQRNLAHVHAQITYRNIAIGCLALCLLGAIAGMGLLYRRIKAQKKESEAMSKELQDRNDMDHKRIETLEQHFNNQIDDKNKELASNALLFLRITKAANDIMEKVKQLKVNFALRGKEKLLATEIEQLAEQLSTNKDWNEFTFYFEQTDKAFLKKLTEQYPTLTPKEKQYCILFNLNLSNKDIANLTGKTLQSIGMAKFRLKEKMGLDKDADLAYTLQQL